MPKISNVGWLNSNTTRVYPFREGSTLSNGTVKLPKDFLVDAILSGTDPSLRYRVNYVEVISAGALQVGLMDSSGTFLGVVNLSVPLPTNYITQLFQPVEGVTVRGRFVFGKGANFVAGFNLGRHLFGFSSAELEPSVLVPLANESPRVNTLSVVGQEEIQLTGDVKLEGGDGVSLTTQSITNSIRFDLSKQFALRCPEDLNKYERCTNCIKYINGIAPRSDGNFDILGTEFISVENDAANHRILVRFVGDVNCCCTACNDVQELINRVNQVEANNLALAGQVGESPDPNASSVTAVPQSGLNAGFDNSTITVTVLNSVGDPMASVPVTLSAPQAGAAFAPISGTTNGSGVFTSSLSSGVANTYTVMATVNPGTQQVVLSDMPSVTFV